MTVAPCSQSQPVTTAAGHAGPVANAASNGLPAIGPGTRQDHGRLTQVRPRRPRAGDQRGNADAGRRPPQPSGAQRSSSGGRRRGRLDPPRPSRPPSRPASRRLPPRSSRGGPPPGSRRRAGGSPRPRPRPASGGGSVRPRPPASRRLGSRPPSRPGSAPGRGPRPGIRRPPRSSAGGPSRSERPRRGGAAARSASCRSRNPRPPVLCPGSPASTGSPRAPRSFAGLLGRTSGSGFRSRHNRYTPIRTTTAVVMPMVGKLLVNGKATEIAIAFRPPEPDLGPSNTTAPIAVIANTRGGWTIGPNRLRLRTRQTATTQPTTKAPW